MKTLSVRADGQTRKSQGSEFQCTCKRPNKNHNGHALSAVWRLWQRTDQSVFSFSFMTALLNSQQSVDAVDRWL